MYMNEQNKDQTGPEKVDSQPVKPTHEKNVGMAVVAYILFFVPLLTDAKDDPFVKYHVKQGLVLFIAAMIANATSWMFIPLMFFMWIFHVAIIVLAILGILNAVHGKKEPLPFIGQFAEHFAF